MKRKMFRQLMAASLATAMTVGLAGCGSTGTTSTTGSSSAESSAASSQASSAEASSSEASAESEEEVGQYTVLKDENGNVYDLGGMEIIIRDWWSGDPAEPTNDYEEAQQEYREWIQETYNFTIKSQAISDWGSAPSDFVEYATTGGDENYIFVLRDDPALTSAIDQGLAYDLSTLDCLDFTESKFTKNKLHEQYSRGDAIYCMYAGDPEPRTGVYFNKRLLTEAGIDPESIYDMQADGTWTWDAFEEVLAKVQRDTNNDGVIDVYGVTQNASNLTNALVWSNNAEYVGKESDGTFTYKLENPETLAALEEAVKIFNDYSLPYPDGANWDYYKEAYLNGEAVFLTDDVYCAGDFLSNMEDDFGFVMFPKGPNATDYTNCWSNNPVAIPACYDADKAWKIAFAWNLYTDDVPGYEDYESWRPGYYANFRDTRSVDESIAPMVTNGFVTYDGVIPNLQRGSDLTWNIGAGTVISETVESIRDTWKSYIDEANSK